MINFDYYKMRQIPVIEIQYLPPVAFFSLLKKYGRVMVEVHESYVKQSYRNRCRILGPNKVLTLSIPVVRETTRGIITEVLIDHSQNWVGDHWKSLQASYGNAPYFDHFGEAIKTELYKKPDRLYDLNMRLLNICLSFLRMDIEICTSSEYRKILNEGYLDMRSVIHPKKIIENLNDFRTGFYSQTFGSKFVENLSVVDLLFNEGPNAGRVLEMSIQS